MLRSAPLSKPAFLCQPQLSTPAFLCRPCPQGVRIPVFISGTIVDNSGRTLSGQTNEAFWHSVSHAKPLAVGLNCALGATDMKQYIANLSACADCYVFCYPNAGLPNAMGGYDQKGPEMAEEIRPFCEWGRGGAWGGVCAGRGAGRRKSFLDEVQVWIARCYSAALCALLLLMVLLMWYCIASLVLQARSAW